MLCSNTITPMCAIASTSLLAFSVQASQGDGVAGWLKVETSRRGTWSEESGAPVPTPRRLVKHKLCAVEFRRTLPNGVAQGGLVFSSTSSSRGCIPSTDQDSFEPGGFRVEGSPNAA
ncbi:hypothetical protein C8Q74DRAFT_1299408 [Fomes fomentarius]|nr:hypothetical protein C8Q74DRAFT_1299408 [Fomes fomentarius]